MQEINLKDTVSIVSFGHICQSRLSDLNKCVTDEAAKEDYSEAAVIISELNDFSKRLSQKNVKGNKLYMDGLRNRITDCHLKWVMQAKTYEQLLVAQKTYTKDLEKHIEYAKSLLSGTGKVSFTADSNLRKRIDELELTRTIAVSFASHIELCRKNAQFMASKLQSTVMTVLPLLNSEIMFEGNEASIKAAKKIIDKVTGDFSDSLERESRN